MANAIPSTPADGMIRRAILTTVAGTLPTLAELAAVTTVDASCYYIKGGHALTTDQATIADERECSTQIFGQPGTKTYGLALTGIDNTNSPLEDEHNKLVEVLPEGAQRYSVSRRGLPYGAPWAAGQEVTIVPFKAGVRSEVPSESNSVLRSTWQCFITGDVVTGVLVAA